MVVSLIIGQHFPKRATAFLHAGNELAHVGGQGGKIAQNFRASLHHLRHGLFFRSRNDSGIRNRGPRDSARNGHVTVAQQAFRPQACYRIGQNIALKLPVHAHHHLDIFVPLHGPPWGSPQKRDGFHVSHFHAVHAHRRPFGQPGNFRQIRLQPVLWPQNSLAGHVEDSGCQHRQAHHHEQPHPQLRPGKLFSLWHFVLSSRIPKRTLSQIHAEKRFR